MATIDEKLSNLGARINGLQTRLLSFDPNDIIQTALGEYVIFGCKVTSSESTNFTVLLQGQAAGDSSHLNPNGNDAPTRGFQYWNIAVLLDGSYHAGDLEATVEEAPATGLGRYDIAYIFVSDTGSGFAVASGTPSADVKTAFDADGLDTDVYPSPSGFDPEIPLGAYPVARIYVEDDEAGIPQARIADLRRFFATTLIPQDNYSGVGAPTVNDDSSAGYAQGSKWYDVSVSPIEVYICVDASLGAAQWENITVGSEDLGTMAVQNANAVAITGGTINGVTIGGVTPAPATFTTATMTGITSVTDATQATSTTAASLKTAGGLGVVKDAFIGGLLNLAGALLVGGAATLSSTLDVTGAVTLTSSAITSAATTGDAFSVTASSLTSGRGAYVYSNSADTSTRNLFEIHNDNALATGTTALFVQQDSTGITAHFRRGSAGVSATSNTLVAVENSSNSIVSILSPNSASSIIYFGSPGSNTGAVIGWNYDSSTFTIGTKKVGASTVLCGGAEVTNVTLSGASGSQLAAFSGRITATAWSGAGVPAISAANADATNDAGVTQLAATLGVLRIGGSAINSGYVCFAGTAADKGFAFSTFTSGAWAERIVINSTGSMAFASGADLTLAEGKLSITDTADENAVLITSSAATQSAVRLVADSVTTGNGLSVSVDGITTGNGAIIYSNSANTGAFKLLNIWNDNALATGATALYVRNDSTGNAAEFVGKVKVSDSTTATSTTSGSFQTLGGVGIGGSTYIGGNLNLSGGGDFTMNGYATLNNNFGATAHLLLNNTQSAVFMRWTRTANNVAGQLAADSGGASLQLGYATEMGFRIYCDVLDGYSTTIDVDQNLGGANSKLIFKVDTATHLTLQGASGAQVATFAGDVTLSNGTLGITNTANETAFSITSSSTANFVMSMTADGLTSGRIAYFGSNSADTSTRYLVDMVNDNALATGATVLRITQDAAATGLSVVHNANASAVNIQADSVTSQVAFRVNASGLTTGQAAYFYSNSATSSGAQIVKIEQLNASATNISALTIAQNGGGAALEINNAGNAYGLILNASSLTSTSAARIYSNSSSAAARELVQLINDHTSATGTKVLTVQQDAAMEAVRITQNANGAGLFITAPGVTSEYTFDVRCDGLTSGRIASFSSNSSDTNTRYLVNIHNDHASAGNTRVLRLVQDAPGIALQVDLAGNGYALYAASAGTTDSNVINIVNADSLTTGSIAYFHSNASTTNTRNLVSIVNDNALATGTTALYVQQDSTGWAAQFVGDVVVGRGQSVNANAVVRLSSTTTGGYGGYMEWVENTTSVVGRIGTSKGIIGSGTSIYTILASAAVGITTGGTDGSVMNLLLEGGSGAQKATFSKDLILAAPTVPASAGATGTTGMVSWDADYIYVCTATNTWKRAAIATWP